MANMTGQSKLSELVNKAKDKVVSLVGGKIAGHLLSNYGEVKALRIDAKRQSIVFEIELKGENELTKISIAEYKLLREESGASIVVKKVTTSKEWITALLNDYIVDLPIRLPCRFSKQIAVLFEQL